MQYHASYERTLGKGLWPKLVDLMQDSERLTTDQMVELSQLHICRSTMGDDAWFTHIGQVARECPDDLPRHERLEWLAAELYRRGADC